MCSRTIVAALICAIFVIFASDSCTADKSSGKDTAHKPIFTNCSIYAPTVKEEQPRDSYVMTVRATDEDPPDFGGTITYSIVKRADGSNRNYFKIDEKTGDLRTALDIDRDEPHQDKEFYITVKASDNGIPVLEDICTFKITVLDVNDNEPQFDKSSYDEKVSEDLKPEAEVMRVFAYDIDDGENARLSYKLEGEYRTKEYFRIDNSTGVIYLKKQLTGQTGEMFKMKVIVSDNAENPKSSSIDITITVIGSGKQPPSFIFYPKYVELYENHTLIDQPIIARVNATSNIEKHNLVFELPRGLTKQTNSESTFQIQQREDDVTADIILRTQLDYEKVTEYSLTVRVTNADGLTAVITINIKILDVNDEIPTFIDFVTGSVLENDLPGAEVMQVRAIDKDGTEPNNLVTYEFDNSNPEILKKFEIDPYTGKVVTKVPFDRELEDVYTLKITAKDGAPSALSSNGGPNKATQAFTVKIQDRNDNKPKFEKAIYVVDNILENADIGKLICEVRAFDKDTASIITYSIVGEHEKFDIESKTGRIIVKNKLDYEKDPEYNLTVVADDGIFNDSALVIIKISNVDDELPIFDSYEKEITINEEQIYEQCIIQLKAYDPDITDRNADQQIDYQVGDTQKESFKVDKHGCVTVIKPLDREATNGHFRQVYILAFDKSSSSQSAELKINLNDINDNAPFLTTTEVVWYENEYDYESKFITTLTAEDKDTPEYGGPPFHFALADNATDDIRHKFKVDANGLLYANVVFDREEIKYYIIPIAITDQDPLNPQTGVSNLKVIIGDRNDNQAQDGFSEIFVYNKNYDNVPIGRVYVTDPDDWDLPDKVFQWAEESDEHSVFDLHDDGMIYMRAGAKGNYTLSFDVTENATNTVKATVSVIIQEIPEEAVLKSGSMRIQGASIEDFIEKNLNTNKKDVFQNYIANVLKTSPANVDVFTVLPVEGQNAVDVRFSAHGSPYHYSEELNSIAIDNAKDIEKQLGYKFDMININECMEEGVCASECSSVLNINNQEPSVVFTNQTSFVGVKAVIERQCSCVPPKPVCYGEVIEGTQCLCHEGQEGENCEILGIGFNGNGWALYPSFQACEKVEINLDVTTAADDGLIFYVGPESSYPQPKATDFMSLEVRKGYLTLLVNYGTGITNLNIGSVKVNDRKPHHVKIIYTPTEIELRLDHCSVSTCQAWGGPNGSNKLLNVNGPLQVGGIKSDISTLKDLLKWSEAPTMQGLHGCVRNFTFNHYTYNLGQPGNSLNAFPNCQQQFAEAVSFSIDGNFLVAILVCVAILVILLLAVVVHRRKQDSWHEKDADDIRETIISYEDEGGGEVDTGYDLSVLQKIKENDVPSKEKLYKSSEVPDIRGFLNSKKNTCDRDPNNYPFDDVRYYAYEGDGNSSGSLSSLASCTDDGDLKFNYLSSFGPRFRKLADMYGEQPSDDESAGGGEESWC